jgi:Ni/Co efflux regulator RcnB
MKTVVSTLVALSVLAGIAALPAAAAEFNSEKFWTQQDREHYWADSTQPLTTHLRSIAMKTIFSALLALSVLAGIAAAPASADDNRNVFDSQSRQAY